MLTHRNRTRFANFELLSKTIHKIKRNWKKIKTENGPQKQDFTRHLSVLSFITDLRISN